MRFTQSFLDEIRERVPISSVIGRSVTWDKRKTQIAKGDFWACCPFHGEKSPSFHCEDQKGRYYCFGCGASGDHLRFMTEHNGMSFPEAVEHLAAEAGVPMPARDEQAEEREKKRADLYDVMDMAQRYFLDALQSAQGAKARAYLRDRGITGAIQQEFGLGFAPDSRNGLKQYLAGKNITAQQIEAAGLVVYGDDIPVSYDRFRGRVMFPIHDSRGRVIAFGGRALSSDVPAKYLNSPETVLFKKGEIVYNHHRARKPIADSANLIACEGYMDVIALAAAGFRNVVASLGTALTARQLEIMWRMTGEPTLCFDGDKAGLKAAHRTLDVALPLLKPGRSVQFALLPEGLDPDDLVRQSGAGAFRQVLNQARPLADMLWIRETIGGNFDTPERRAELEARFRQITSNIENDSIKRHYSQDIRNRLEVFFGSPKRVQNGGAEKSKFRRHKNNMAGASGRLAVSDSLTSSSLVHGQANLPSLRDTAMVIAIVNHPALLEEFFDDICEFSFEHPKLKKILAALMDIAAHDGTLSHKFVAQELEKRELGEVVAELELFCKRTSEWHVSTETAYEDARQGWLQALHLHHRAITLNNELKAAEQAFAEESTQENYDRLLVIREEIVRGLGTEAQITGFGLPSGRPTKPF